MVDLRGSHPRRSGVSGNRLESSSLGWGPFLDSEWLGLCLYKNLWNKESFITWQDDILLAEIQWQGTPRVLFTFILRKLNIRAQFQQACVWWPNKNIPDLSAPSGGSWASWLSSHAMKSLGSLSSLLLLLSSVGVLLSQLPRCVSSSFSLRSRVSSPSISSLSKLNP